MQENCFQTVPQLKSKLLLLLDANQLEFSTIRQILDFLEIAVGHTRRLVC
jgi:hypothetical protein